MTLFHFPKSSAVYKSTRTGVADIVGLTPGETYTVSLSKNGATARLIWNDKPGTSALDSEWTGLTNLDTSDDVNIVVPAAAKAIALEVTVAAPGIPRPAVAMTVVSFDSKAIHSRAHAYSGRSGGVAVGFVEDEYDALVLADGADVYWAINDGIIDPLTNEGPQTESNWTDEKLSTPPVVIENEPWPGARSWDATDMRYRMLSATYTVEDINQYGTIEMWIKPRSIASGRNLYMWNNEAGMIQFQATGQLETRVSFGATALADPGAWTASTAYVVGDRVRAVLDNSRMAECTVAGTSGASEPTWPTNFTTVADNTVTWQDCGPRSEFNEVGPGPRGGDADPGPLWTGTTISTNLWYHVVCIRRANGNLAMYINGSKAYELDVQKGSGNIGTEGVPIPYQVDTVSFTAGTTRWLGDNSFEEDEYRGAISKFAIYQLQELTDAEILAHYNKGVELGA